MYHRNPPRHRLSITVIALTAALAGCSDGGDGQPAVTAPAALTAGATPAPTAPVRTASATPTGADPHAGLTGRVPGGAHPPAMNQGRALSATHVGAYTYLEVEQDGRRFWMASARADVQPGQTIRWADAALMRNFTSRALGREFPEILFVAGIAPAADSAGGGEPPRPSGKVVSVVHTAGYSFIEVDADQVRWLAAPMARVEVGDSISWRGGATMRDFTSKSLNRTFDEIVFVSAIAVN